VYCRLYLLLSVDRMARKSVIAREGARGMGSSSSSSKLWWVRWRLVPARCRREGILSDSCGSWLDSRRLPFVNKLDRRASMRLKARLGLMPDDVLASGSMLCRTVGESPLS
jgi:hypothetical protein